MESTHGQGNNPVERQMICCNCINWSQINPLWGICSLADGKYGKPLNLDAKLFAGNLRQEGAFLNTYQTFGCNQWKSKQ